MRRRRRWGILAALAALLVLALPALGRAAVGSITLQRDPAPPQAISIGAAEALFWQVEYASVAKSVELIVTDPTGAPVFSDITPFSFTLPGQGNPQSRAVPFLTQPGFRVGRYTAAVQFTSDLGVESTAASVFDVAAQLGTMVIVKYEDLNGNGVRDPGEPTIPNWAFNLINPSGNPSTVGTLADGTRTIINVPAGTWTVGEPAVPGWAFISPAGGVGTFTVPPGGTGVFQAGNARPAPLSGVVWIDTNRNGVLDAGEQVQPGALVTLTGVTGTGAGVGGQTTTLADGSYVFGGLLPGTYSVSVTVPSGFTATTPTTLGGLPIISNTPSPNHNFGIVPAPPPGTQAPSATPTPGRAKAAPGLTLTKTGPSTAQPGTNVVYAIKVTNPGTADAKNVVVTDPLPPRMTFVRSTPASTLQNGVVTWKLGTLKPKASRSLTLTLKLDPTAPPGVYTNTATARATGIGPRRATVTLRVPAKARTPRTGGVTG